MANSSQELKARVVQAADFFHEHGFVVIDVFEKQYIEKVYQEFRETLERGLGDLLGTERKPGVKVTLDNINFGNIPGTLHGILGLPLASDIQAIVDLRFHELAEQAFKFFWAQLLFGDVDHDLELVVSKDRTNFQPARDAVRHKAFDGEPPGAHTRASWWHFDQNPKTLAEMRKRWFPNFSCIQGGIQLSPVSSPDVPWQDKLSQWHGEGGLCVLDKSHLAFEKIFRQKKSWPKTRHNFLKLPKLAEELMTDEGARKYGLDEPLKPFVVRPKQGQMVFWFSHTMHQGVEGVSSELRPERGGLRHFLPPQFSRAMMYVSMMPKVMATPEDAVVLWNAHENGRCVAHWAGGGQAKTFPRIKKDQRTKLADFEAHLEFSRRMAVPKPRLDPERLAALLPPRPPQALLDAYEANQCEEEEKLLDSLRKKAANGSEKPGQKRKPENEARAKTLKKRKTSLLIKEAQVIMEKYAKKKELRLEMIDLTSD